MKKLILILLSIPFFIFSQEEREYEKTISFSQFAQELKDAANNGNDYTLESCSVTYNPLIDKKYVLYTSWDDPNKFVGDMIIKGVKFNDTSEIIIKNCKFGEKATDWNTTITFEDCSFGKLDLLYNDISNINIKKVDARILVIKNIKSWGHKEGVFFNQSVSPLNIQIDSSKIWRSILQNHPHNETKEQEEISFINLKGNDISFCEITSHEKGEVKVIDNSFGALVIKSKIAGRGYNKPINGVWILNNEFKSGLTNLGQCYYQNLNDGNKYFFISSNTGLKLTWTKINQLSISGNMFHDEPLPFDSIFKILLSYEKTPLFSYIIEGKKNDGKWRISNLSEDTLTVSNKDYNGAKIYNDSLSFKQKIIFFKQYLKENNIPIYYYPLPATINISSGEFKRVSMINNQLSNLIFSANTVTDFLSIKKMRIDSVQNFSSTNFPTYNRCFFDTTTTMNIGWRSFKNIYYGHEQFQDIDTSYTMNYMNSLDALAVQYRQFITILDQKGGDEKKDLVISLKDLETNKKNFQYYVNPNLENWFNWQGAKFLKWYSDYGMNPFKALAYCFWAMLYFAMFYFIFYNEWDKIDRGFLINKFNSVMDYFTTEKRIEDFYTTTHNKEMTTFTEFKHTLNKNKVYMPSILISLAKPIYQISLLRYKLLSFSYKKAEFMAGKKWVDLKKKERYWIGTLTFFLTLTYISYLIFIRALNSIVLSINAFSTLGFGQIPVRGITKYVAIIEGFIGWFMLSIFLVSVLSQMMSI